MTKHFFAAPAMAAALAAALVIGTPARAGLMAEFESKTAADAAPSVGRLRVEPDRMRLDSPDGGVVIFRGDKQTLWIVKEKEKSYTEVTRAQAKAMADQVAALRMQLEVQMSTMPPEQRAILEQALNQGAAGPGGAQPPRSYVKTGRTARVNSWPCVEYSAMRGDKKESEVWVTDWKNLGATLADFKVLRDITDFMKLLAGPQSKSLMPGFMDMGGEGKESIPGFPVKSVRPLGKSEATEELKKFARQANAPALFEIPAGYTKREFGPGASPRN